MLLAKNVKLHRRDAECAEGPRRLARERTFTIHGSRQSVTNLCALLSSLSFDRWAERAAGLA
jgi:hypothetical protein